MAKKKSSRKSKGKSPEQQSLDDVVHQFIRGLGGGQTSPGAAQEMMQEAFETENPRQQIALARKAIEIEPDCVDAFVLMAELAETLEEAMELYREGVAAGERALGEEGFREYEGQFWGFPETRPYMRARQGLAEALWAAGEDDEAIGHYREMLRLNPGDNQGIRYRLASALLELERHEELDGLLQQYEEDDSADWTYTRALLAFREEGDSLRARKALLAAKKSNQHVPDYLTGGKAMPRELPEYVGFGDENEAISYAAEYLPAWKNTPGAITWLRKTLKVSLRGASKSRAPQWRQVKPMLAALPQIEEEVWQVDVQPMPMPVDDAGEEVDSWLLLITNATQDSVMVLDLIGERPAQKDVWERLLATMRGPDEGDPHRPQQICVRLKTYQTAWQSKLKQIGIECLLRDDLDHVERVLEHISRDGGFSEQLSRMTAPISEEEMLDLAELPQRAGEVWQADARPLQAWLNVGGEPMRPWTTLVGSLSEKLVLASDLTEEEPAIDTLWASIQHAMARPAAGEPHRPVVVQVANDRQRQALGPQLEAVGVQCVVSERLELVDQLLESLSEQFTGPQRLKATLSTPGVTPAMVGGFFDAAADYYRRAPWRKVPGDSPIKVECEKFQTGTWYAVVMGQSGMTLGLAMYESLDLLTEILSGRLDEAETSRRTSGLSVTFGEPFDVAPADFDAAQQHGWPVAGPEAYPCPLRVNPGFAYRPPLAWELELLEGCLRAIPDLLDSKGDTWSGTVTAASDNLPFKLSRLDV